MAAMQFPGFGWRRFDEQFRLGQEAHPSRSWGVLDSELWITVAAAPVMTASQSGSWTPYSSVGACAPKTGFCFGFNSVRGCHFRACKFLHKCSKCFAFGHSALLCRSSVGLSQVRSAGHKNVGSSKHVGKVEHGKSSGSSLNGGAQSGSSFQLGKTINK